MSTRKVKPTEAQRTALQHFADGDGPGESWSNYEATDRLAWYRHERTLDSLRRHGWTDGTGITPAGREALAESGGEK